MCYFPETDSVVDICKNVWLERYEGYSERGYTNGKAEYLTMNNDYEAIKEILSKIRAEYISCFQRNEIDNSEIVFNNPRTLITERDIVAEIYCRLKEFCDGKDLRVHTEIKPVFDEKEIKDLKLLPRIDIVILSGNGWIPEAIKYQNKYDKGDIEARFSAVPVEFFHTAIEVKIQSKYGDAKDDIGKLKKYICEKKLKCNCFLVLLNARGKKKDHDNIKDLASEEICVIDYTCNE